MKRLKIVLIISSLIILSACKKETDLKSPIEKNDNGVIINVNPFSFSLLNSELNSSNGPGMEYSEAEGTMEISKSSLPGNFLQLVDTGLILTVDLDSTGILRQVDGISEIQENGEAFIVLETSQAEMEDLFLDAEFNLATEPMEGSGLKSGMSNEEISKALTDKNGYIHPVRITVYGTNGKTTKSAFDDMGVADSYLWENSIDIVNRETENDTVKVTLDSHVKAYSNFALNFNFKRAKLKSFKASYKGGIEAQTELTSHVTYKYELDETKKLKDDLFKISYKFMVGFVPVFVDVVCDIYGNVKLGFEGQVTTYSSIKVNADTEIGVQYKDGLFSPITVFSAEKEFIPLIVNGSVNLSARAELYPQFAISIYSTGGPVFEVVPYISAEANASISFDLESITDAGWDASVDWGIDARIGAKLEILGKTLTEYKSGNFAIIPKQNIWSVPVKIEIFAGNNQIGYPNQKLDNPIVVKVYDSWNNSFPGIPVKYFVPAGNGSVDDYVKFSNLEGKASNNWTLGNYTGTESLKAFIKKADGTKIDSVTFEATAN